MDRSARRLLASGVVLVLWGLITHGTFAGTGDEPHYQMIAHSLVFDGDLDLSNDYADTNNLVFGGTLKPDAHATQGKDGRLRPLHDIGLPLLFSPYYVVAYRTADYVGLHAPTAWLEKTHLSAGLLLRHLLSLAMIGITAWIGVQLFDTFAQMVSRPQRALIWAALLVLSPPLLSHSFLFFTEIVSAAIVLWVFLRLRRPHLHRWEVTLAGAAVGYLMLVHVRNAGLVIGLFGVGLHRLWRSSEDRHLFRWFAGAALVALAARTLVTYHFFGTWLTTPLAHVEVPKEFGPVVAEVVTRMLGWIVDQEHGLLPYAPIYLLLPAGWIALWKRDRTLWGQISFIVAAYVALMALPFVNAHGWRGAWAPAARFLVPVTPLLAIVVFSGVAALPRMPLVVSGLIALQVMLDAYLWQHPKLMWNDGQGVSALLSYLDGGTGGLSHFFPSLAAPLSGTMLMALGVAAIFWLGLTAWLIRRASFPPLPIIHTSATRA